MIILKKLHSEFPNRVVEWGIAYMLATWGAILLLTPGHFFVVPVYSGWAAIAPQNVWGGAAFVVGLVRIAALYVNGAHSRSPVVRTVAGFGSMFIWFFAFIGLFYSPWITTGLGIYFWLMMGDAYAIYVSAGDWAAASAKLKDEGRQGNAHEH